LFGGGHPPVEHFICTQLHFDGLDVGLSTLDSSNIDVVYDHENGTTGEHGDDAQNEHNFKERISRSGAGGYERELVGWTGFHTLITSFIK